MNGDDERDAGHRRNGKTDVGGKRVEKPEGQSDPRLLRLHAELDKARARAAREEAKAVPPSLSAGAGMAWRMGSEFVAGVIVGFVLGYALDRAFGTSPWGLIVFLLLGFAAGTLNVMRSAGLIGKAPWAKAKDEDPRREQ